MNAGSQTRDIHCRPSNVAAVIVTYNPDLTRLNRLVSQLAFQVGLTVVIDNASEDSIREGMSQSFLAQVEHHWLKKNEGIAAGQNKGIAIAFDKGCDAVVFFDQDSVIEDGLIDHLLSEMNDPGVGVTAPVFYDETRGFGYPVVNILPSGRREKYRPENIIKSLDVSVVISSGMMVRRSVLEVVGLMDERLFIDYVDTEWCLRSASKGFGVRVNPLAYMRHSIGDTSFELGKFQFPVHSPARRYYRIRNAIFLLRLPHVPKLMAARESIFCLIHQLILIVSQKHKMDYVFYYFKAARDGVFGVMGPLKSR